MPLKHFDHILNKICTPDEKYQLDIRDKNFIVMKNKAQILMFLLMIIMSLFQDDLKIALTKDCLMRISWLTLLLTSLLSFCRKYLHLYYVVCTFVFSFAPVIGTADVDTFYLFGVSFYGPVILFAITDNCYYYGFTAIVQLYNLNFCVKQAFIIRLDTMGYEVFSEKLVKACSLILFCTVLSLLFVHQAILKINHELRESKVEAEGSLSHYKNFLFSFSHEVRNPINILLGSLDLSLQESIPAPALELIQTAKISGEILLQLINNVLDVGKAEVGKLEIVPTPIRVHDLLLRMWTIISELIKKKKLCGYLKVSTELPTTLEIDADRINQILLNLLGNAIKFTQQGTVNLTIDWLPGKDKATDKCFEPIPYDQEGEGEFDKNEALSTLAYSAGAEPGHLNKYYVLTHAQKKTQRRSSIENEQVKLDQLREDGGILKITVRDQGCGMSAEALKGLFKKFYQCSTEASQRKRGTGLGLYITKDICEIMEGQIRVYSKVDVGSVFIACIPCKRVEEEF